VSPGPNSAPVACRDCMGLPLFVVVGSSGGRVRVAATRSVLHCSALLAAHAPVARTSPAALGCALVVLGTVPRFEVPRFGLGEVDGGVGWPAVCSECCGLHAISPGQRLHRPLVAVGAVVGTVIPLHPRG